MANVQKAHELVAKAEKKLKGNFLGNMFGGTSKYEDAVELFAKAANNYKLAKEWKLAAETFVRVAECHKELESIHEMTTAYVEAAHCYKKIDVAECVRMLELAIEQLKDNGRLSMAAKYYKEIAEIHEQQGNDAKCIDYYKEAAHLYQIEGTSSSEMNCNLKVAEYLAKTGEYAEAIETFESVAMASLDNNLLKFSVRGYLLWAGICHLCVGDPVAAAAALERYEEMDPSFAQQRECKLLRDCLTAMDEGDVESFTNAVYEYDRISRLDPTKTSLLLKVKKNIQSGPEEEDLT
mmetsp:Transcript_1818/g.6484  ORF Transcript_1818/g.6484 Transcript_1818/m.6484 type:complete len:293 (+) Transcript_1818:269-1147(+)